MNDRPWYYDCRNIAQLAEWLVDEEGYTAVQLLRFLDKPHNWTPEWEALNQPNATVK